MATRADEIDAEIRRLAAQNANNPYQPGIEAQKFIKENNERIKDLKSERTKIQTAKTNAMTVTREVAKATNMINQYPDLAGNLLSPAYKVIPGSKTQKLDDSLQLINQNMRIDTLQAIRDASETGSAGGHTGGRSSPVCCRCSPRRQRSRSPSCC